MMLERRTVARLPAIRLGAHAHVLAGLSIVGLLVMYGVGDSRGQLTAVALGGAFVCVLFCIRLGRWLPQYYTIRLLIIANALQLVALGAIAALGLPLSPPSHPFNVDVAEAPFRVVLAMLTVPAGALIAAWLWRAVSGSSRCLRREEPLAKIAKGRRVYLVIACVAMLLYWPSALEDSGVIGYFGRILAAAFMVAPFLAGRDSLADRHLAVMWSVGLLVNSVIGMAAGSRSMAFIAVVLFGAGYVSALPKGRARLIAGGCAALVMVPLIQAAGALGVVRDDLGRGGLELFRLDRVQEVFDGMLRQMTTAERNSDEIGMHGIGRLLPWPSMVVPLMSPESIPYRGFDGFVDDAVQTFRIASLSGLSVDDLLDAGLLTAQARPYGFTVTSSTAVEFPVVADGWSRGGAAVALLFGFIAALGFTVAELCAFRLHRYGTGVATVLALPVAKGAFFDASIYPLLPSLRGVIVYTLVVAVLVVTYESVRQITHNARRRGFIPAARPAEASFPGASRRRPMGIQTRT
jgi:hypothetical protein